MTAPEGAWSCRVELLEPDGPRLVDDEAELRIGPDGVVLHYFDDLGPAVFVGEVGTGPPFRLVCRSRPCVGTLESAGEGVFEGVCEDVGEETPWRITLTGSPG
ncbi:MAG: hypothetical protein MJE66_16680 [Proteobacteria bacterium]|nr:hypothetical protein [Pseudomonadota bacterium]